MLDRQKMSGFDGVSPHPGSWAELLPCISKLLVQTSALSAAAERRLKVAVAFKPRACDPPSNKSRSDVRSDRQTSGGSIVASRLLRSPGSFRGLKPTATVKSSLRDVQRSSPFTNNFGMHRNCWGFWKTH